jgi:uncharacterized protein
MLWIIVCTDKPGAAALRAEHLPVHRTYLQGQISRIYFSGPLESDDGSKMVGSVFIINAPSRAQAEAFIHEETLYQAGVFETVSVRRIRVGRTNPDAAVAS